MSAEKDGFQNPNIIKVLKGRRKSHKGYFWKYKDSNIKEEGILNA